MTSLSRRRQVVVATALWRHPDDSCDTGLIANRLAHLDQVRESASRYGSGRADTVGVSWVSGLHKIREMGFKHPRFIFPTHRISVNIEMSDWTFNAEQNHNFFGLLSPVIKRVGGSLENTCHTWALLRWWFTKRLYIKCTYLYPNLFLKITSAFFGKCFNKSVQLASDAIWEVTTVTLQCSSLVYLCVQLFN